MRKISFITIFLLCLIVKGEAQKKVLIVDSTYSPFTRVEGEAVYPRVASEWTKYLQKNLNPNVAVDNKAPKGRYLVIVRFIVAKDSSISDVVAETNHGYGMEQEVVRVIKKDKPKWTPAKQKAYMEKAYRRQSVTFLVE
jgi:periplasmic protein TonB